MGVDVDVGGGLFLSLNLLIIICYIVYVSMYIYTKGIVAQQKSYGFKNFEKLEVRIFFFFFQNQNRGDGFLFFMQKFFFLAQEGVLFE